MEFLYTESRYNVSSMSQLSLMKKKVGLSIFYDNPSLHIVFKTRNLTKFLTHTTNETNAPFKDKCLLSSHGLIKRGNGSATSLKPDRFDHALNLLPPTICKKHNNTSFLPLDYVRKLPEYTRTTQNHPIFKVVHNFDDCVLEFPFPPPIGSSNKQNLFQHDYMNNCYQCFTKLSSQMTIFMYRDYLFCCPSCRATACSTSYWYKKMMEGDDEEEKSDDNGSDLSSSSMEGGAIFTIES